MRISPSVMRKFHAAAVVVWVLLIPPTLFWWKESILWVAMMSIWANIASHWSAFQATGAEQEANNDGGSG